MKKTQWYPASINPVRAGLYEVKRFRGDSTERMPRHFLLWSHGGWTYAHQFEFCSAGDYAYMNHRDGDMWRGLTKEPA